MAKIFEHYAEESLQHKEIQSVSSGEYKGVHYHKLFRNVDDPIAFAQEENLAHLKELIDSESKDIVGTLGQFIRNQSMMQNLINKFTSNMEENVHYISTHGVSGRCAIERELGFLSSSKFGRLTRLVRRRILAKLSTYSSF